MSCRISSSAVPSAPAPGKPQPAGGKPSRSLLALNDCAVMPPVTAVRTPLELREPLDSGRSPDEMGPPATPLTVQLAPAVGQAAKMPLSPSEIAPTFTPVPSTWYIVRTSLVLIMPSP